MGLLGRFGVHLRREQCGLDIIVVAVDDWVDDGCVVSLSTPSPVRFANVFELPAEV